MSEKEINAWMKKIMDEVEEREAVANICRATPEKDLTNRYTPRNWIDRRDCK